MYGHKEARIFTLQGIECSPRLVPQLYWNLFSSLEGRLQPITSHEPSGLHYTVPQDPYQATATRKEVLMNLAGVSHGSLPQGLSQDGQLGPWTQESLLSTRASRNLSPTLATRARSRG